MILGPFTGEPGYELLYWIPYLRHRLGDKFKDCTAITRGGAGVWYPCKTLDAYDYLTRDEYIECLNVRARARNTYKSDSPGDPLDRLLLKMMGLKSDIHPSECIETNVRRVIDRAAQWPHERLPKPPRLPDLPEKYIAVRFYEGRQFHKKYYPKITRRLIREAREKGTVVLLALSPPIDDHDEIYDLETDILVKYAPRQSLETISRVVAHAEQFVCTYGGLSYLGALYGTPTVAVSDCVEHSLHYEQEDRMATACGSLYVRLTTQY